MCIDQNGFSVMLAKRSVGVTPELNLKNSFHIKDETNRQGIHPGLETKNKIHQKFKTWVTVAPQKRFMTSKFCFNNIIYNNII